MASTAPTAPHRHLYEPATVIASDAPIAADDPDLQAALRTLDLRLASITH